MGLLLPLPLAYALTNVACYQASFCEEISQALGPANEIGHAIGTSSAADVLKHHLEQHHPQISQRVIAIEMANLSSLTEAQIEALAKKPMIAVV